MSTHISFLGGGVLATAEDHKSESFLKRLFGRLIEIQQARAERAVYRHLSSLSSDCLVELGFDPAEIRRFQSNRNGRVSYWV